MVKFVRMCVAAAMVCVGAFAAALGAAPIALAAAPGTLPVGAAKPSASVATPADDVAHPGSQTEWWYASVVDPVTRRAFIVAIASAPVPATGALWYGAGGSKSSLISVTTPVVATAGPQVSSSAGVLSYDSTRQAYHLIYNANGYAADIWFDNALPGVTLGPLVLDGQWISWTVPVATSTVTGWVRPPGGAVVSVNGWRGYHDHNWGDFSLFDQRYSGWEWAISHEPATAADPHGHASLLGGMVSGDGTWQGVLAHIDQAGTTFCPSTIQLSDWTSTEAYAYPATVKATCTDPSMNLADTFTVTDPYVLNFIMSTTTESVGQSTPGSVGLIEHFRTLTHGGTSTAPVENPPT